MKHRDALIGHILKSDAESDETDEADKSEKSDDTE